MKYVLLYDGELIEKLRATVFEDAVAEANKIVENSHLGMDRGLFGLCKLEVISNCLNCTRKGK